MSDWAALGIARPGWLLLLALALPWILWSRRQRPRPWPVGGLGPFRDLARRASRSQGWPWSLIAGLAALLCASLAAAGLRRTEQPDLWLVDGSYSYAAHPDRQEPGRRPPVGAQALTVGDLDRAVDPDALLEAARWNGAGRRVVVLTDAPEPPETPPQVDWRRPPRRGGNAALLALWRRAAGITLRWARWGLPGPLVLDAAGHRHRLEGDGGLLELPLAPPGSRFRLLLEDGSPCGDDQPQDDAWELPPVVAFQLPAEADPRWRQALAAAWPGCLVLSAGEAVPPRAGGATVLPVRFGASAPPTGFEADPFSELPELDAVAAIAARLAAAYEQWHPSRPGAEGAPAAAGDWGGRYPAPVRWREASRPMAVVGLLLYLLSLALRRAGR